MEYYFGVFRSPGAEIFNIGPFSLRWYGLLIALSVFIGLRLSTELARRRNLSSSIINDILPILLLSSIIGARIYYVVFEWRNFSGDNFWSVINILGITIPIPSLLEIWGGGIAIHGALIGGALSITIFCRLKRKSALEVFDVLLPSVALGQAIGRWGNFFNNEAFGIPTDLPWKIYIPLRSRPAIFTQNEYFHPTFLYESIWNICIFLILLYLFKMDKKTKNEIIRPGFISSAYLMLYGIGRLWIESLRIDPLCFGGLPPYCSEGVRMAQMMSIIFISMGAYGLYRFRQKTKDAFIKNISSLGKNK
tara:strand:+ start:9291 stop:10208 length:918 start_codon:yes stop_codon:yes gene_type:complete